MQYKKEEEAESLIFWYVKKEKPIVNKYDKSENPIQCDR